MGVGFPPLEPNPQDFQATSQRVQKPLRQKHSPCNHAFAFFEGKQRRPFPKTRRVQEIVLFSGLYHNIRLPAIMHHDLKLAYEADWHMSLSWDTRNKLGVLCSGSCWNAQLAISLPVSYSFHSVQEGKRVGSQQNEPRLGRAEHSQAGLREGE